MALIELARKHWLALFALAVMTLSAVILSLLPGIESASLAQMSGVSIAISLMRFALAIAAVFLVLRLMDIALDMDIGPMSNRIERDPVASAQYLGLRFVAVAWVAAACVG